jgi:hypothetical protein
VTSSGQGTCSDQWTTCMWVLLAAADCPNTGCELRLAFDTCHRALQAGSIPRACICHHGAMLWSSVLHSDTMCPSWTALCRAVLCAVLCCAAQTADDMLCRALYALEGAWVHGFDPATGNVRLDFESAPNRGLFLALFRHAQVSRWGGEGSATSPQTGSCS